MAAFDYVILGAGAAGDAADPILGTRPAERVRNA
jgi:hypothetical protein